MLIVFHLDQLKVLPHLLVFSHLLNPLLCKETSQALLNEESRPIIAILLGPLSHLLRFIDLLLLELEKLN